MTTQSIVKAVWETTCDRCGATSRNHGDGGPTAWRTFHPPDVEGEGPSYYSEPNLDLCGACVVALRAWLKPEGA